MVSEVYCDGLGACLGVCPQDAITIEEREAEEFDLAAKVEQVLARLTDWSVEGILAPDERTEHRFEYPVLAWCSTSTRLSCPSIQAVSQ